MRDDSASLRRILGPVDEADFFRDHWGRAPLVIPGDPSRFDGLFGVSDLETYLFTARPPAGDVRLVRNGQFPPLAMVSDLVTNRNYDVQALYNALGEGYTVVLNALHERWPAAARLVRALEEPLLATVQTNVYVTGPGSQGFARHQDDHDVFVLQTAGSKRWTIFDVPGRAGQSALLYDVELACGDALYMPAGFPHAAAATSDVSIHVTVGIYPLSWHDVAREVLEIVAAQEPSWHERVPIASGAGDAAGAAAAELARRWQDAFSRLTDLSPVVERYRQGLAATARRRNPPPSGYLDSLRTLDRLDAGTEVERRPGVGCHIARDGAQVAISFMGQTVRAPASVEGALRFIAATPRFRIADIDSTLPDASKVVLVRRLIREGLLQMSSPSTRS